LPSVVGGRANSERHYLVRLDAKSGSISSARASSPLVEQREICRKFDDSRGKIRL
jgi:hypothetical protein